MEILIYMFLGLIQGITEPIPVSSSGHLIIFQHLFEKSGMFNASMSDATFEVIVNTGSLIAIMYFFRKDIMHLLTGGLEFIFKPQTRKQNKSTFRYITLLIIATIPAGIFGILFKDQLEANFANVRLVGFTLLITASLLLLIHYGPKGNRNDKQLNLFDAIRMGLFQVVALIPGISRSGSTISGGLLGGLSADSAIRFSFLMYMPVSVGAIILKIPDLLSSPDLAKLWLPYFLGFIVSMIATYFALVFFIKIIKERKLNYFAFYCIFVGLITIFFIA